MFGSAERSPKRILASLLTQMTPFLEDVYFSNDLDEYPIIDRTLLITIAIMM